MEEKKPKLEMSVEELRGMLNKKDPPIITENNEGSNSALHTIMSFALAGFTLSFAFSAAYAFVKHSWGMLALSLFLAILFFVGYRIESRNGG